MRGGSGIHFDTSGLEDAAELVTQGIDVVRVGYADLIGTERGRDVLVNRVRAYGRRWRGLLPLCLTGPHRWATSSTSKADSMPGFDAAFLDLGTIHLVPWEPGVAHVIADVYNPDGSPSEESPRMVLKRVIQQFAELGMRPIAGPELSLRPGAHRQERPDRLAALRRGNRQCVRGRLEG